MYLFVFRSENLLVMPQVMFLLRDISLVQVHRSAEGEEEEEARLLRTFEEIQFLIEDLDNANSRIHFKPF